ncbi:putative transcription factor MYB-HB-like family [Helianthus annuus]|nr:putative transcription factor MYB-HB-like family [Helianthus annuus]
MLGCTSRFMLVVNAELDSMRGVGIPSTPSRLQSSDLEKTQAELRQSFTAAEKFRRELEFLQKGGDPLDLKPANAASISFQSTSLKDRHPEQFVTSEAKGSFAITASPHGDSVESSARLGAPSVCEPNSADNLMLLKESGDSAVLELPKKSYKRRIRSRPNRDPVRQASRDFKALAPDANVAVKNSISHLENESDGMPAVQSTLGPANHHGLPAKSDGEEAPLTMASIEPESLKGTDQVRTTDSKGPTNGNTEEIKSLPGPTKVLDSESSCTQTGQRFDDCNGNGLPMKQNLESNNLDAEKNARILNIDPICNEDGPAIKEGEGLKESESVKGVGSDGSTDLKTERKPVGPNSISQDGGANDTPLQESTLTVKDQNTCSPDKLKLATKEHEDSILEEARIIEAKRKRIAELSVRSLPLDRRPKSHWDFVLEEMSWLANDFAQERLWKITAAAQLCRRVSFASRLRLQQQSLLQKRKEVSHDMAEAVMQFWHMIQVKRKGAESNCIEKISAVGIQGYAMRFMEYNNSRAQYDAAQAPVTHDVVSDLAVMDHSWEDNLTEENLFYTVPPGAIEAYRKAIDSHLQQLERTGTSMQEEVDTSCYDAVADNAFREDEGETDTCYLSGGFEGSKSIKNAQKRRKNFKLYGPRSYEMGADMSFMQSAERNVGNQPSVLSGKRSGSSLNVTVPTKRVRTGTASRQRIISSFNAGVSGHIQTLNRTDASSADTNSFHDEQSTFHGGPGPQIPNNMEAESAGDYEKQFKFDSMEVSNRPKKKKKEKHPGSAFEHRWQLDSNFQNDQKDHIRRRLDTHQFDSNGSSVASQMSNMSNPNKFMKLLARDHGRKGKALKTPVGQPGSGSAWSLFEDQALVVLVHDMGPNWELISDAINSTLPFKCIFRKSNECKERHKILMDMNSGDGADSAEDSGSSHTYPSTLPGIPEGSARQLFQRLQGPMEEETLKSHFEKIIKLGQKQHYRRTHNDNHDPRQVQQPHSSHAFALSQVCPNNLNGGPVLTPLELSETISPSPDALPAGYQGPQSGGLPALNHGPVAPMLPGPGSGSGSTSSAPGSSSSVHGSNLPSASAPHNPSVREGRYGIPRTGPLSVDDQQRMQQYNRMLSARNSQQSGLPPGSHSVNDRGVRILPAGSGMGVMCGVNRNMKMARPGFPGVHSQSMLNSGSATPSPSGMHSGMLRPRDPMHLIRANQNTDQKLSQSGTTQGYPHAISPQQSPHMLNSNSHHFQGPPNHHANPAFAMRLAKERQLQQQRLLQQQQQFSTSSPMMPPHVQPQESQLPAVSSPQNTAAHSSSPPMRNPQTSGNQLVKQQRPRLSQQQQQAKLMKGGRGNLMIHQNHPTDSSVANGFPGSSASKPSVAHSSLSQSHQQKTFSDSSDNTKNQNHGPPALNQKLVNQKQVTASQKLLLLNRKVNTSDQTNKQAESSPMSNTSSQPSTLLTMPNAPCNDATNNTETTVDNAAAVIVKNPVRVSPPKTSSLGTDSEPFGPPTNQVMIHRQSSSDNLPNPVDVGIQQQQQQQQQQQSPL